MRDYRPLNQIERMYLCQFIRILVPVARASTHPMRGLALNEISLTMWRWTSDAVEVRSGAVKQDAIKYNTKFLPATRKAMTSDTRVTKLVHEHAVPECVKGFETNSVKRLGNIDAIW